MLLLKRLRWGLVGCLILFAGAGQSSASLLAAGSADSLLVTAPDGSRWYAIKENVPRIPASVMKILTASAVFHYLKPSYRFRTRYHLDEAGRLWMTGFGDPLYVSEVLRDHAKRIALTLEEQGIPKSLSGICLDDSVIPQPIIIPGINAESLEPYDAPNGALCANFNTVLFKTDSAGRLVTAEPQTPLVNWVKPLIRASGRTGGRIHLTVEQDAFRNYPGYLMAAMLSEQGVSLQGPVILDTWADNRKTVAAWEMNSPWTMDDVVERLLRFSNNFIANQLMLTLGREKGAQVNAAEVMAEGCRLLRTYGTKTLNLSSLLLVEGSGVSRQNRISCVDMDRVLAAFFPFRERMVREGGLYYKTGTLTGITARAGFLNVPEKGWFRFVIFCNTPGSDAGKVMRKLATRIRLESKGIKKGKHPKGFP